MGKHPIVGSSVSLKEQNGEKRYLQFHGKFQITHIRSEDSGRSTEGRQTDRSENEAASKRQGRCNIYKGGCTKSLYLSEPSTTQAKTCVFSAGWFFDKLLGRQDGEQNDKTSQSLMLQ